MLFSQVNNEDCFIPLFINSSLVFLSFIIEVIPFIIPSISSGLYNRPASPTTSGIEETFDATTGRPFAIASNGGKPKPSYQEGNNKQSTAL